VDRKARERLDRQLAPELSVNHQHGYAVDRRPDEACERPSIVLADDPFVLLLRSSLTASSDLRGQAL
jgi:hypothetical protein